MTKQQELSKNSTALIEMTGNIVSAYLSRATVPVGRVPKVIALVHATLQKLDAGEGAPAGPTELPKAAISIRKSVTPDYIVCLEDGKKLRMLKRYLRTNYGMSPEEYRARWNLPADYPMVAPSYAQQRSDYAKQIGLGKGSSRPRRKA